MPKLFARMAALRLLLSVDAIGSAWTPRLYSPETRKGYQDPAQMLRETKPDIFCFCTPPSVRLPLIRLGVEHGVKLIAYEKPMATSFHEAAEITDICRQAGAATAVSHQITCGSPFHIVNDIIES